MFDKKLSRLANDEAHKKDNNIHGNKPEAINTEQQQRLVEETWADEEKEAPYREQHQSNRHQLGNAIEPVRSKATEQDHLVEDMSDESLDITFSDEGDWSEGDSCVLESLQDSFVEVGTKEGGISLSC